MNKKILIADDHYVVRLGTRMILEEQFSGIFIDFAENYEQVKQKLYAEKFDLLILDIDMEGSIFKFMVKELKSIQEDIMILIFSTYKEDFAVEYIQEGAKGYLNKLSTDEVLVKAVKSIFEEGYYYPLKVIEQLSNQTEKIDIKKILSEREYEVFELLAEGNGNIEISNILQIHINTASTYKRRIYNKLGAKNFIDLLKIYRNHNPNWLL